MPIRIPLSSPDITESDVQAVTAVLRTTRLSQGPALDNFEQAIAGYLGAPQVIAVSSGTAALHLCLRAFGVGEGDEVILPSFAFIAVANAVRYQNAIPVFVDIEPYTLNLDPATIAEAITPRTRGIIVVHTFGVPAEMSEILEIGRSNGLFVIEDACEAIGATYYGQKCGTMADAGVFGFYPNKQITAGEGGAIVTRDGGIARKIRALRNQGRMDPDGGAEHGHVGYNYRLSEMNCALGNSQLQRLEGILQRREAIAAVYSETLRSAPHLKPPPQTASFRRISWFVYVVRLGPLLNRSDRDWILAEIAARGIACGSYFVPIHLQPCYHREPCKIHRLPVTEWVAERTLALPFFNRIKSAEIQETCEVVQELVTECMR